MPVRAIKAIILKEGSILILRKSDKVDIYPGQWDLPGGRLDPGESWNEGLSREVREETALEVTFIREIRTWQSLKWDTIGKTVACDYVSGEVQLSWEHTEYYWVVPENIITGDFPEWIRNDVKSLGL
ncbi:MAG: Nucleoside triphosphatase [Promethearchaeota archaeon CR_4]|nr:MAG: Nucleoside triphosphatase [Candidatus Lokiarchaeota archaeon CR_4]